MLQPKFSCCDSDADLLLHFDVATQLFLSRQHLCYGSCCNIVLHIVISVATQKVCRDRVLLPLNLFPCCNFIFFICDLDFCVGGVLHVATPICYVATTLFCMQHIFLSQLSFSSRDITCLPLACLRVVIGLFYVQLTCTVAT